MNIPRFNIVPSNISIYKTISLEERFWSKVNQLDNGCWEWTGCLTNKGYGLFYARPSKITSHRLSWLLKYGNIPKNVFVLHHCDNRKCVNPDHLFIGTQKDNLQDMTNKGRRVNHYPYGELNPSAKLNLKQVQEIREQLKTSFKGLGIKLALQYGVTETTISYIRNNRVWNNL